MRIALFSLVLTLLFGLYLWVTLSGALLVLGLLFLAFFIFITVGYSDKAVLFFLGARSVRSHDEPLFYQAAAQEAYKLSVPVPELYFYNGSLERGFVLQNGSAVSLVIGRGVLEGADELELSAICFELLLQVKKGMAPKRTKVLFVLGLGSWLLHSLFALLLRLVPWKELQQAVDVVINYLLHPTLEFLYRLVLGQNYFRRLEAHLRAYPEEYALLMKAGPKLSPEEGLRSLPTRKLLEFSSVSRSRHFQNIMALEFLPHEWDLMFLAPEAPRA
jgi:hypothetical protein